MEKLIISDFKTKPVANDFSRPSLLTVCDGDLPPLTTCFIHPLLLMRSLQTSHCSSPSEAGSGEGRSYGERRRGSGTKGKFCKKACMRQMERNFCDSLLVPIGIGRGERQYNSKIQEIVPTFEVGESVGEF